MSPMVKTRPASGERATSRQDWCTPQVVLERVRRLGIIALDPCSNRESIVNAASWRMPGGVGGTKGDGLSMHPWAHSAIAHGGLVFCNPPYSKITPWVDRCILEGAVCPVVALLPASVETRWWRTILDSRAEVAIIRGRLRFLGAPGPATFPCALIGWGIPRARWYEAICADGWAWEVRT